MAQVRVTDADAEVAALKALAAALEPLDESTRKRVLEWAGNKFVNEKVTILLDYERAFMDLLSNIQKAAEKGGTSWPVLVHLMEEVVKEQYRERDRLREAKLVEEASRDR